MPDVDDLDQEDQEEELPDLPPKNEKDNNKNRPSLRQLNKFRKLAKSSKLKKFPKSPKPGGTMPKPPTGSVGGAGAGAGGGAATAGGTGAAVGGGAAAGAGGAAGGAATGAVAVEATPVGWIITAVVILIILIIIIIVIIVGGGGGSSEDELANNQLTITKAGPSSANTGDTLSYQVTVTYPGTAQDIVITDRIPDNTEYIDSTPVATFDPATRTATWNLGNGTASLSNVNTTLVLNLRATGNNTTLVNIAQGTVIGGSIGGSGGPISNGFIPPNQDNCGGRYSFRNSTGNFGDPSCNFDKNALHEMLRQQDPANADRWFFDIIPCESGYNPNAYAPPSTGTPDAAGAWGMYQMGSSTPAGQPPPSPGKNGEFDRGDVNWPIQTSNAITYSKRIRSLGAYWACAR